MAQLRTLWFLLMLSAAIPAEAAPCVVLVHGLGRSPASMEPIGKHLSALGFVVVNKGYPSRSRSIEASAEIIGRDIDLCRSSRAAPIDFVTHSLGAILLRQYLSDHTVDDAGRVVMLAPPNHGSEIVDHLHGRWWYDHMIGAAGGELGTDSRSLPNRLGPMPLSTGVIAGTRSHEPWFSRYFHGLNDGKVSVESTRLDGMSDFITIDASHTFIMNSQKVQDQVAAFLVEGRFRRSRAKTCPAEPTFPTSAWVVSRHHAWRALTTYRAAGSRLRQARPDRSAARTAAKPST